MDTGEGRFVELHNASEEIFFREKYPKAKSVFRVGEEVTIKESRFRVTSIGPFGIKLKLLRSVADENR